jgi:hypothetical protein
MGVANMGVAHRVLTPPTSPSSSTGIGEQYKANPYQLQAVLLRRCELTL